MQIIPAKKVIFQIGKQNSPNIKRAGGVGVSKLLLEEKMLCYLVLIQSILSGFQVHGILV